MVKYLRFICVVDVIEGIEFLEPPDRFFIDVETKITFVRTVVPDELLITTTSYLAWIL
jgi:hypothetical protein